MHLVYESLGNAWYEMSTDNGTTWELKNGGQPLSTTGSKLPAIDSYGNEVAIVWQEKNGSGWTLKAAVFDGGVKITESTVETGSNWSFDTTPTVAWAYNGKTVVAYRDYNYFGQLRICYRVGSFSYYGITWHGSEDYISNSSSNSYKPTIAARDNYNVPTEFHIAWETNFSSTKHIEYQKIKIASDGTPTINSSDYKEVSTYSYGSHYGPYPTNENASIDVRDNGEVQLVWVGRQPGYAKVMKRTRYLYGYWGSSFSYFDYYYNLYTPTIRYASDRDYAIAWGRNNSSNAYYWNSSSQTISSMNTTGRDVQLFASESSTQVKGVVFNSTTLPYNFTTTGNVLSKKNSTGTLIYREAVVASDEYSFRYKIGDVKLNGQDIKFTAINDTTSLKTTKDLSEQLLTEPFQIDDESVIELSISSYVDGKEKALAQLGGKDMSRFEVELIDTDNGQSLGVYGSKTYSKEKLDNLEKVIYRINAKGIENRKVRLKVKINNNIEGCYSVSDIFIPADSLFAKEKVKEVVYEKINMAKEYSLAQNYPNPFNPTTEISYALPQGGKVVLKIYDVLGNEVKTIVNGTQSVGMHTAKFNASRLASGVYIYRIEAGRFAESKKMILMK